MPALGLEDAAHELGISKRSLSAHLKKIGAYDDAGNPRYRLSPGGGKMVFKDAQIAALWEHLPGPNDNDVKLDLPSIPQANLKKRRTGISGGHTPESPFSRARAAVQSRREAMSGRSNASVKPPQKTVVTLENEKQKRRGRSQTPQPHT